MSKESYVELGIHVEPPFVESSLWTSQGEFLKGRRDLIHKKSWDAILTDIVGWAENVNTIQIRFTLDSDSWQINSDGIALIVKDGFQNSEKMMSAISDRKSKALFSNDFLFGLSPDGSTLSDDISTLVTKFQFVGVKKIGIVLLDERDTIEKWNATHAQLKASGFEVKYIPLHTNQMAAVDYLLSEDKNVSELYLEPTNKILEPMAINKKQTHVSSENVIADSNVLIVGPTQVYEPQKYSRPVLRLLSLIDNSSTHWPQPSIETASPQVGPLMWGRSLKPTWLDALCAHSLIVPEWSLNTESNSHFRMRFREVISSMSRNSKQSYDEVITGLFEMAKDQIQLTLKMKKLNPAGPFSDFFDTKVSIQNKWILSRSTLLHDTTKVKP